MQKPSFTNQQLPPLGLKSSTQPLNTPQQQSQRPSAGRFMPMSAELRKKKEELRKKQREDILGKFDSLGSSAKKDTPKLQEKVEVKPEQKQQSQPKQQSTTPQKQQTTTITTEQKLNQPLIKSSSPPQSAAKQPAAKQDPLAALAKTVKGKSGNAIEELRKKMKK